MESKTTWCYVQDFDGSLWVADVPPEQVIKKGNQWVFTEDVEGTWYEISAQTLKPFSKYLLGGIDFKQLPVPKWSDPYPIVITLKSSLSYYIVEDQ